MKRGWEKGRKQGRMGRKKMEEKLRKNDALNIWKVDFWKCPVHYQQILMKNLSKCSMQFSEPHARLSQGTIQHYLQRSSPPEVKDYRCREQRQGKMGNFQGVAETGKRLWTFRNLNWVLKERLDFIGKRKRSKGVSSWEKMGGTDPARGHPVGPSPPAKDRVSRKENEGCWVDTELWTAKPLSRGGLPGSLFLPRRSEPHC